VTNSLTDLPRPIAYVLSGGGPLGAIQVGMLRALAEHPIRPDLIVGVSAGAINGALVASDPEGAAGRLDATWSALDREQVFPGRALWRLLTLRRHPDHVFPATGLKEVIEREAGSLRIEDLPVRFAAIAVDASNGEPVLFDRGQSGGSWQGSPQSAGCLPAPPTTTFQGRTRQDVTSPLDT